MNFEVTLKSLLFKQKLLENLGYFLLHTSGHTDLKVGSEGMELEKCLPNKLPHKIGNEWGRSPGQV